MAQELRGHASIMVGRTVYAHHLGAAMRDTDVARDARAAGEPGALPQRPPPYRSARRPLSLVAVVSGTELLCAASTLARIASIPMQSHAYLCSAADRARMATRRLARGGWPPDSSATRVKGADLMHDADT